MNSTQRTKTMISTCLLLIALSLTQTTTSANFFTPTKYNSTEDWSIVRHIYRSPPLIVQSNGSLIHVLDSDDPEHAIHIYSLEYGLCKVPLKLNFHQRYPRRAITLGNGKIVIWLLNYRLTHEASRVSLHEAKWRFAIVEPRTCASAPSILAIKDSEVDYKPMDVVDVVGYHDYFEVFLYPLMHNSQKNIYGFRYYDNGEPIRISTGVNSVIPDRDSHSHYHPNTVRIHPVLSHDASDGYFYLKIKPKPRVTFIKRFDTSFQLLWNVTLKKSTDSYERFDSYSVGHGNLTYCQYAQRHLHCLLLDALLQAKVNVTLEYEEYVDYFSKIGRFSVSNTPDGGVLLVLAVDSNYRIGPPVYVQKIEVDGQASEPVSIGRFYCEVRQVDTHEMLDGSYCVCVVCDEIVHTRCFALDSYDVSLLGSDVDKNITSVKESDNDLDS